MRSFCFDSCVIVARSVCCVVFVWCEPCFRKLFLAFLPLPLMQFRLGMTGWWLGHWGVSALYVRRLLAVRVMHKMFVVFPGIVLWAPRMYASVMTYLLCRRSRWSTCSCSFGAVSVLAWLFCSCAPYCSWLSQLMHALGLNCSNCICAPFILIVCFHVLRSTPPTPSTHAHTLRLYLECGRTVIAVRPLFDRTGGIYVKRSISSCK